MPDAPMFAARAHVALRDIRLGAAVRNVTGQMVDGRQRAFTDLADPEGVRDVARAIRYRSVERLPDLLESWATHLEARGGQVHWATDAAEAVTAIREILRRRGAHFVVKGKSMASEEIHLNEALEDDGVEVLESDLGEFIIQLAHESPAHIIVPAIHKDRNDVSALFTQDAGRPIPPDIPAEAAYARERLRTAFLTADVGISGVNFAVADTGSICLVTNEGNGRMVTSVPPVHIAIMGMERIVASWPELDVMLALLARSATGQRLTSYTNVITGPRQADELDGPEELHVVVLDAGRTRILGSEVPRGIGLHPLRRMPQRLPGVPPRRRSRLWLGVSGSDRRGADASAPSGGQGVARACPRLVAVRGVRRSLSSAHPSRRHAARAAPARCVGRRTGQAGRILDLVGTVELTARLCLHADRCQRSPARGASRSRRAGVGRRVAAYAHTAGENAPTHRTREGRPR